MLQAIKKYQSFIEPVIFYVLLAISLHPIFSTSTFPFADAPAHLGNASLVKQLLAEPQGGFLGQFISFNQTIVPNWAGHFILAVLLHIVSPETAEKVLLVVVFAGLPLSVRYLLHVLQKEKKFLALLAIPIAYNCYSGIGFYNFSLSLIFTVATLAFFYQKILTEKTRWFHYLILACLFAGAYFSHIVGFFITVFFAAIMYALHSARLSGGIKKNWFSKKTLLIVIAMLPVSILAATYTLSNHGDTGQMSYLKTAELVKYLKGGHPFMIFGGVEATWCDILAAVFGSLFILTVYFFVDDAAKRNARTSGFVFLIYLILLIAGFFYLPDGYGLGGYLSLRIATMIFLFVIPFAALSQIKNWFLWMAVSVAIFVHLQRLTLYTEIQSDNNRVASAVIEQAAYIEDNSFIVVYDLDPNWLQASYSHYLCWEKPVIAFNNYEYNTLFFPLVWKNSKMNVLHGALYNFQALELCKKALGNHTIYYWVKGNPAEPATMNETLKKNLENNCILINSNIFASLYKLR